MSRVCAYCGEAVGNTREHIFSNCLLERAPEIDGSVIAHKPGQFIPCHQVIKDVCGGCNNEDLSEVDDYICNLFDRYFGSYVNDNEQVDFDYDYDLLARWLLKTAYNADRANSQSSEESWLSDYTDYMLGSGGRPKNLHILVLLVTEYEMDAIDKRMGSPDEYTESGVLPPMGMGATRMVFSHPTVQTVKGYLVLLKSYFFFPLMTEGTGIFDRRAVKRVKDKMLDGRRGLAVLPRWQSSVTLRASELNSVNAYERFNLV